MILEEFAVEMAFFDALLPRVRQAVASLAVGINVRNLAAVLNSQGAWPVWPAVENGVIIGLAGIESQSIAAMARDYQAACGFAYPHVAAGASVLR
jgi:hypothetical protein